MSATAPRNAPRLRHLPMPARAGVTALLVVFAIGLLASAAHMRNHHENRDGVPGLSMTDLVGAYHGINVPSPLAAVLRDGHPEGMPERERALLLKWLDSPRISEMYDDLDLGDDAPVELIAMNCLACHTRATADFAEPSLVNWDDIRRIAFSTEINPLPVSVLVASTHAHALTLAAIGIVLILALLCSRWGALAVGSTGGLIGIGLLLDIGGWWVAREYAVAVWAIVVGGGMFNLGSVMALVLILGELWLPRRRIGNGAPSMHPLPQPPAAENST